MYSLFDVVKSKKALSGKNRSTLERGSEGTILEIYNNGSEVGYNVEFMDSDGNTTAILVVAEGDLEPIETRDAEEVNLSRPRLQKKQPHQNKKRLQAKNQNKHKLQAGI